MTLQSLDFAKFDRAIKSLVLHDDVSVLGVTQKFCHGFCANLSGVPGGKRQSPATSPCLPTNRLETFPYDVTVTSLDALLS